MNPFKFPMAFIIALALAQFAATVPMQVLEIAPDQKIVWALRSWTDPNLGPATTIQLLDQASASEQVHFGAIK